MQPITPLPNPLSKIHSQTHPLLLLTLLYLSLPSLISHPTTTLLHTLPLLLFLQLLHAHTCLPPHQVRPFPSHPPPHNQLTPPPPKKPSPLPPLLLLPLLPLLTTPLLILLGAPLTTHLPHTLLAAAHITTLALTPVLYTRGVRGLHPAAVTVMDEVWGGAVGACVGGWVGAVPIPLDW